MEILVYLVVAYICFELVRQSIKEKAYKSEHRVVAENAFRALSMTTLDPCFSFEGSTAQVMDDKERVEKMNGAIIAYVRTIIARNESGEYFWFHFRTDNSHPLFKHIDHSSAKALLKEKYIASSTHANDIASRNS
jgi:hypothetical protein